MWTVKAKISMCIHSLRTKLLGNVEYINEHRRPSSECLFITYSIVNVLKFQTLFWPKLCFMHFFLNILNGMANSVDPDQTAPTGAV